MWRALIVNSIAIVRDVLNLKLRTAGILSLRPLRTVIKRVISGAYSAGYILGTARHLAAAQGLFSFRPFTDSAIVTLCGRFPRDSRELVVYESPSKLVPCKPRYTTLFELRDGIWFDETGKPCFSDSLFVFSIIDVHTAPDQADPTPFAGGSAVRPSAKITAGPAPSVP